MCFPVDFKFQYSTDGVNFIDVPGQSYTGYAQPAVNVEQVFTFGTPVNARYIRLFTTKISYDGNTGYYEQVMEFNVDKDD